MLNMLYYNITIFMQIYKNYIHDKYKQLLDSGKTKDELDNNDSRILNTYQNKKLGGYIQIENEIDDIDEIEEENNENEEEEDSKFELRFEKIYSSFGVLKNGEELWNLRFELVKKYIDDNNKRPSATEKIKNVQK